MKEFKFTLSSASFRAEGSPSSSSTRARYHDFKISGKKSKMIGPGKSGVLIVTLTKGSKAYLCTVPGHAAGGMKERSRSPRSSASPAQLTLCGLA